VGLGIMEQMMFENNFCMCSPIHGRVSQDVEGILRGFYMWDLKGAVQRSG